MASPLETFILSTSGRNFQPLNTYIYSPHTAGRSVKIPTIVSAHERGPLHLLTEANEVKPEAISVLETFEIFPKLPKELRLKVWRLVFELRIVVVKHIVSNAR